jgi:hypothetical protein
VHLSAMLKVLNEEPLTQDDWRRKTIPGVIMERKNRIDRTMPRRLDMHARLGESRRWFAAHIGMAALSVLSVFAAAPLAHADFMAIVDDGFDDSDIGTNPLGVGSGHTLLYSDGLSQGGWVGESDSQFRADIRGTPYYWDWAQISSKDKALNVRQPGWTTRADWQVSFAGVSIAQPYHFSQFPDGDPAGTAADIYSEFGLVSGKRSNIDAASDDLYRNIQGGLYVSLFYDLGSGENNLTITGNLRAVNKNHPDFGIYEDSPGLVTLATFTLGTRDFISGNPSEDLSVRMEIDNDGYRVGLYNFSNGSEIDPSNLNGSLSGTWSAMQSILDGQPEWRIRVVPREGYSRRRRIRQFGPLYADAGDSGAVRARLAKRRRFEFIGLWRTVAFSGAIARQWSAKKCDCPHAPVREKGR